VADPAGGLVIYAKELAALVEFYRSVLSLETVERGENFVVLQGGSVEVVVVQVPEAIAETIEITKPPVARVGTSVKPVFTVPSLIDTRSRVLKNGGTLQPEKEAWRFRGAIVLDGCDREGNVIQFRQFDL
jgi:catechol 2,3-dioxygenase-like lactoylglutathione lyase family enzyme